MNNAAITQMTETIGAAYFSGTLLADMAPGLSALISGYTVRPAGEARAEALAHAWAPHELLVKSSLLLLEARDNYAAAESASADDMAYDMADDVYEAMCVAAEDYRREFASLVHAFRSCAWIA